VGVNSAGLLAAVESNITEAQSDGMTPVIVLAYDPGYGGEPHGHVPDDNDYYCGLQGLMNQLTQDGHAVHFWELFNEPDCQWDGTGCSEPGYGMFDQYSNGTSWVPWVNKYGDSGARAAADLYHDAVDARAAADSTDQTDWLIAGGVSSWSLDDQKNAPNNCNSESNCDVWFQQYVNQIAYWQSQGDGWPDRFSGHPYDDVTSGGADGNEETANLVRIAHSEDAGSWVWLTETGDWLDDPLSDGPR
jgi:hypothetical protein